MNGGNAALTARRYGYIRDFQLQRNPGEEPAIDTLVRDYLGTVPPGVVPRPDDVTVAPGPISELRAPDAPMGEAAVPPSDMAVPPLSAAPPPPVAAPAPATGG